MALAKQMALFDSTELCGLYSSYKSAAQGREYMTNAGATFILYCYGVQRKVVCDAWPDPRNLLYSFVITGRSPAI